MTWMFWSRGGRLDSHDQGTVLHDLPAERWIEATSRIGDRESRASSATHGFKPQSQTIAASKNGSAVLGLGLSNLEKVARVADHRQIPYGRSMASEGTCPLLDVGFERESYWPSRNQQRDQGVDPENG
jgi:hypothetical protein